MNIAFLAHDKKKELMVQFCTAYKSVLMKHTLFATATTGRLIGDNTGLPITLLLSHKQGGHQQINARIAYNEIDLVLLFTDPNTTVPCLGGKSSQELLTLSVFRISIILFVCIKSSPSFHSIC